MLPDNQKDSIGQLAELYEPAPTLDLSYWGDFGSKDGENVSAMQVGSKLLADAIQRNPQGFRMFSPDELESNKLDAVFEIEGIGHRNFQTDPSSMIQKGNSNKGGGRIIEMLSEHTLQGFAQGYSLTGRTCIFPSYESFLGIVSTMIKQYAKFFKNASETNFGVKVPSINYIETSTLWRREHNGFSQSKSGFDQYGSQSSS